MILGNVMTAQECAQRWHVSGEAVRKAIRVGRLPATKSGGTWLVSYPDMVAVFGPEPRREHKEERRG